MKGLWVCKKVFFYELLMNCSNLYVLPSRAAICKIHAVNLNNSIFSVVLTNFIIKAPTIQIIIRKKTAGLFHNLHLTFLSQDILQLFSTTFELLYYLELPHL